MDARTPSTSPFRAAATRGGHMPSTPSKRTGAPRATSRSRRRDNDGEGGKPHTKLKVKYLPQENPATGVRHDHA